jgi:hypothetical protein
MTYSCWYKGIDVWFSPEWTPRAYGRGWKELEMQANERVFEKSFGSFLKYNYPARISVSLARQILPRIDAMLRRANLPHPGTRLFSGFSFLAEEDFYESTNAKTMLLEVFEDKESGVNAEGFAYKILIKQVPDRVRIRLRLAIGPEKALRVVLGPILLLLLTPSLLTPILFALADSNKLAQVYFTVEQSVVLLFKWYDWSKVKVNTRFEESEPDDDNAQIGWSPIA